MTRLSALVLAITTLFAGSAQAVTSKGAITAVWVRDNSLYPASLGKGSDKILFMNFSTPVNVCGASQTQLVLAQSTVPSQFDNYLRFAEAAFLSGHQVYVDTTVETDGVCYLVGLGFI